MRLHAPAAVFHLPKPKNRVRIVHFTVGRVATFAGVICLVIFGSVWIALFTRASSMLNRAVGTLLFWLWPPVDEYSLWGAFWGQAMVSGLGFLFLGLFAIAALIIFVDVKLGNRS